MHFTDKITIDGTRKTADGYLVVNARVARAGNIQLYAGHEVGKRDMAVVRVYRPESEVFSKDALASLAHRPVTLNHPSDAVTADTWSKVAKGWTEGEVARDGEFVRLSMLLADADTIRAVEAGTREISLGYECSLIWGDGVTPAGEAYDAMQTRIRGNHVAIVDRARGGPELRIGDTNTSHERKSLAMMTDSEQRAMRDGVKGQPLWKAKGLPLYDNVKGMTMCGMDAREYFAILDGAVSLPHIGGRKPTQEAINDAAEKLAAQNAYERRIAAGRHTDAAPVDRSAPQPHFGGAPALQGNDNGQAAYEARLRAGRSATQDNGQAAYETRLRDAWR